jgi:hypothetical protein
MDDVVPTAEDLALNLEQHLANLSRYPGMCLVRGWYRVEDHRAAIRRALAAEEQCRRLEAEMGELRASVDSQDIREQRAGELCGVPWPEHGCDWPAAVAERCVLARVRVRLLEAELANLRADFEVVSRWREQEKTAILDFFTQVGYDPVVANEGEPLDWSRLPQYLADVAEHLHGARGVCESLAARCAQQAEVIARRAEKEVRDEDQQGPCRGGA